MSREQNLLPCPFCGTVCHNVAFPRQVEGRMAAVIECFTDNCYAKVTGDTPDAVVAAWNRRAPTVSGGEGWEELEALVAACEAEFTSEKTEGESFTYGEPDDSEVSYPSSNITFGHIRRARKALALIAVARGGFSALQASPSVPTEGHGAAVVGDWTDHDGGECPLADGTVVDVRYGDGEEAFAQKLHAGHGTWAWDNPDQPHECDVIAYRVAAISDAEQVGTSVASEPNTLPTVQAETAVVGWRGWPRKFADARYEIALRPDQQASLCPFCENHIDTSCDVTILGGEYLTLAHTACLPDECRAAINAGEQPGMSEANAPSITLPDDLLSLSEAATAGEWTCVHNSWETSSVYGPQDEVVAECPIDSDVTEDTQDDLEPVKEANAALIVASVNFIRTVAARQGRDASIPEKLSVLRETARAFCTTGEQK